MRVAVSSGVKEHTFDLKFREQGRMIQVSIPASVLLKEFDYNAELDIINPVVKLPSVELTYWYVKADDLVLKGKTAYTAGNSQKSTLIKTNKGEAFP